MDFFDKSILIVGEGISGQGAFKALSSLGAKPFFYSSPQDFKQPIDLVVVSPGVPLDNEVFKLSKKKKVAVIGEIELGYLLFNKPIIAITGTNGKTTITELIGSILTFDKKKPLVCGNIGTSFSLEAQMKNQCDVAVVEVSSFQLETIDTFRPHIALISNITMDHLDRHKTMAKYTSLKARICKNQTADDYLITTPTAAKNLRLSKLKSQVLYVGAGSDEDNIMPHLGCYRIDNKIYFDDSFVAYTDDISLSGEHNLVNAMLAISACKVFGASNAAIRLGLKLFKARAYRMSLVGEHNGKKYFNDSKGTNIDACIHATRAMIGETCLIVGGSDKGYEFDSLFSALPLNIVKIYAIGSTTEKVLAAASRAGFTSIERASSLKSATIAASKLDVKNILLSPAAASFDCYKSYEERGKDFDAVVGDIMNLAGREWSVL